jgi:hypothetical protein
MSQATLLHAYDEIANFFARGPSAQEIAAFRVSEVTAARVRDLLEKNAAGGLDQAEADELEQLGHLNRMLLLIRSRIPRAGAAAE